MPKKAKPKSSVIHAEHRFAERRATVIIRELRLLRDGTEVTGTFLSSIAASEIRFAIRALPDVVRKAEREHRVPFLKNGLRDPAWIMRMLNLIGDAYPTLPPAFREEFLRFVAGYLSKLPTAHAKDHVRLLQNPLLIGDILLNCPAYWPNLRDRDTLFLSRPRVEDFARTNATDVADIWSCIFLVMRRFQHSGTRSVRQWYLMRFSDMVERSMDLAAVIAYREACTRQKKEQCSLESVLEDSVRAKFCPEITDRVLARVRNPRWLLLR